MEIFARGYYGSVREVVECNNLKFFWRIPVNENNKISIFNYTERLHRFTEMSIELIQ